MRTLTATLLAAQKQNSTVPYVKIEAKNKIAGVVRYDWERLYTGNEADYYHALAIPGDGSLVRVRVTPPEDSRKLYYQRVADPGAGSDYSQWTYTGQYDVMAVAAAALGAELSIFFIRGNCEIKRIRSTNNGVSWSNPEIIDYSPGTAVGGIAAAYKANGDLALFFTEQSVLYVKQYTAGNWQAKSAWDKTTGDLSGVACTYDADWDLLLAGLDEAGNSKLWSLIYGDGGEVAAGVWSGLKELAAASSGGDFTYQQPFLDKPDVYRAFYVEKFTGNESYQRPFWSHSVLNAGFIESLWREPVPFDLSIEYGLALAHHGDYAWLSCPSGVWRADMREQSLVLTADIVEVREELDETTGKLTVTLCNDDGKYHAPGQGSLAVLDTGCRLDLSPGYLTSAGNEVSGGQSFQLEALEHTSSGDSATLILHAAGGWEALGNWSARHQFRWNKNVNEANIGDILAFVLARVGLKLEIISQSDAIHDFYPDFAISPGQRGNAIVARLLSYVPDVVFSEGDKAYLVNPLAADSAVYSYGVDHPILAGRYRTGAHQINRVQAEGDEGGSLIVADSFDWAEIERLGDRLRLVADGNISTVDLARQHGAACLRKIEIASVSGGITVPVNCGQQLYDVVAVTDARAGLAAARRRVLGISLRYQPHRGEYCQRLVLGAP
ncbi:MAG: hypothetical protein PHR56_06540 [Dehalococcoidales bacterium]|nr:hypothetical protein [Dehalococcoidales bacterium]